ncbi:PEP-CTERM sorting domain-containing protein [Catenovulum agarivorans]|uniref:PEP-CTERM sorting domain-containing protein n=1 Tax=Catenovulum agarivorans TaxID=1172192 RepID=UPI00030DB9E3|nr:PEP-CTERM sorting domain-containing protein [Catenovulum agarivorans]
MKFLAMLFSFAFVFNVNAGLITNVSKESDQLIVDFSLTDFDPSIGQITAEYSFDASELVFASYSDSDYLVNELTSLAWGSAGVPLSGLFTVDFLFFIEPFDTTFDLGRAVFDIVSNVSVPTFEQSFVEALDIAYAPVVIDSTVVNKVSEPATYALLPLIAGLLFIRRRQI